MVEVRTTMEVAARVAASVATEIQTPPVAE